MLPEKLLKTLIDSGEKEYLFYLGNELIAMKN
jgi:hypothetical protein